jgi:hypothetical protein
MKQQFLIFLIFFTTNIFGQDTSILSPFIRSVERNFAITEEGNQDSCFFNYTLLRLDLDSNYSVCSVSFADNAADWQVEALKNVKKRFNTKPLEEYARRKGIKGISFFFPFVTRKEGINCSLSSRYPLLNDLLFRFKSEKINGNCLFADSIGLTYY